MASKLINCVSPFVAEVEALWWAVDYAEQCGWRWVEWEADAKEVEAAVNSESNPTCWYGYYSICNIRKCFDRQGRKVKWKRRSSNMAADVVANLSLNTKNAFELDEFSVDCIPPCILNIIVAKQAAAV